jgi:AAA+ superfamily predicted ATPase
MARADLIVSLVKFGLNNDSVNFKKIAEEITIEERAKQHTILANTLEDLIREANQRPLDDSTSSMSSFNVDNLIYEVKPKRRLDDLILSKNIRDVCDEFIEEQRRVAILRSHNLEPRNKLLLIGEPGNGKTSLAGALADSLMLPLYCVRYDGIIGSYLGETASRLRKVIDFVRTRRCILFLDEFETLGKERGDSQETGEIKRVVSSLLLQIDELPSHVIVIGATNHQELLDRAVWRRFQIRLHLNPPNREQIAEWFREFERRSNVPLEVSPEKLADELKGSSYSDVEEFGTTILRRYVLSLPDAKMTSIVEDVLKYWKSRSASVA